MDVMYERCAGLDIGKDEVTACVRTPGESGKRHQEIRTYPTFTSHLKVLADWLTHEQVSQVVMEATGQYWKPVWYVLEARKNYLHNVFMNVLWQGAQYVRSFDIHTKPNSSYHLFFASNSLRGLEKMKEAVWTVDRVTGTSYSDSTAPGQKVMFGDAADLGALEEILRKEFGKRLFSIEEAMTITMVRTPFLYSHLKTGTLKPLEAAGRLEVRRSGTSRLGAYPAGTRIRLLS